MHSVTTRLIGCHNIQPACQLQRDYHPSRCRWLQNEDAIEWQVTRENSENQPQRSLLRMVSCDSYTFNLPVTS
jgi:hypothetical protein